MIAYYHTKSTVRLFFKQLHYAIASEDRADWSYFDHFSLVAVCDWGLRQGPLNINASAQVND
jgi:hypothetical protein